MLGPNGSGKTTTLYACLNVINRPDKKIITVEDPVEYELSGINQVMVKTDIGMTFAAALRAMLDRAALTGRILTLASPAVLTGLKFTTSADAPERDPTRYALFGANELLSWGDGGWSLIAQGETKLPEARNTRRPLPSRLRSASARAACTSATRKTTRCRIC